MANWSMEGAKKAIIVGGSLSMVYTQLTTSPATVEYARSLGADGLHVGILGALPTGLFFMQFLAALVVNHLQFRRPLWFWTAILQRVSFVPVALGPLLLPEFSDVTWIWLLIGVATLNHGLNHFGAPLWLSWMGDYLPQRGISSFWGNRHRWQQWLAALSLFGGAFVFRLSGLEMKAAFAVLIAVASVVGVIDILLFIKVHEPPVMPAPQPRIIDVLSAPFRDREYRSFIEYSSFWHFSAMVGAPFIGMYLLEEIGMSLYSVLMLWAISWIGGALLSNQLGEWVESHGNRPVLILCTMLKAANMLALLLLPTNPTVAFWVLIPVLMMDAQLNAGITIATNGFMLKRSPQQNRTMFIAAGTAMAGMLGGITAIIAGYGLLQMEGWHSSFAGVTVGGFHVLFAISLVLRVFAIGMAYRIREPHANATRHVWRAVVQDMKSTTARYARVVRREPTTAIPLATDPSVDSQRKVA